MAFSNPFATIRQESAQNSRSNIEGGLLILSAAFLAFYGLALTLSPAVRERAWEVDFRWEHWVGYLVWMIGFTLAYRALKTRLPGHDPYLLPITGLLSGWGLLTIWRLYPNFGLRQTVWLAAALLVLILGTRLRSDLDFLRRYKYLWLTSGLLLTALTLLFGTNPLGYGPQLWLGCCGVYLQPSEPLKLLLIIYLAAFFADRVPFLKPQNRNSTINGKGTVPLLPLLSPTIIMVGLAFIILIVQRDLGTASIFLVLYAVMVYMSTGRKETLFIAVAALIIASLIGYFAFDLVKLRVEAWLNPWLDPSGRSYQIVQSLLAIANGGIVGRGPGLGNPGLVPVPHSDFVFASISEETGLIGGLGLLLLIALFAQRGIHIAVNATNAFLRYLAAGLTLFLVFQSILIIGGNLRLLPLTGVTLPFVSYGGSSLITSFISMLFLFHISSRPRNKGLSKDNLRPYQQLGTLIFIGIALLSTGLTWWSFVRAPDLLTRTDNPRRAISDRTVRRGIILDRDNEPINQTVGPAGEFVREYLYPNLSPVVGYTNPVYGQAGLESSMDETLRGLKGNPGLTVWWNQLLYGQPPPGLDIRTSLNMEIQQKADNLLDGHKGAIVLMNPVSGEILSMASYPSFDANYLEEEWTNLIQDENAPLVNRATQGLYPPATALGSVLAAAAIQRGELPTPPENLTYTTGDELIGCTFEAEDSSWGNVITNGCPGAYSVLVEMLGAEEVLALYESLGLFTAPEVRLPTDSSDPSNITLDNSTVYDQDFLVSPLQIAAAVSSLSNSGFLPAPQIVSAVNTPLAGWVLSPVLNDHAEVISEGAADSISRTLTPMDSPFWENISVYPSRLNFGEGITWYITGTNPDWTGTPLVLVVLLESEQPELAYEIGKMIIEAAATPP